MYCNYILQLCSKLVLGHWPYSVYLYICTWPLAINFANMPINILSLSLSMILGTYRSRVWCKSNMATKWLGLMNPNGLCTKDKERRDLVKCWYNISPYMWCTSSSTFPFFLFTTSLHDLNIVHLCTFVNTCLLYYVCSFSLVEAINKKNTYWTKGIGM